MLLFQQPEGTLQTPYDHNTISVACCVFPYLVSPAMQVRVHNPDNLFSGNLSTQKSSNLLEYGYSHRKETKTVLVAYKGANLFSKTAFQRWSCHNRAPPVQWELQKIVPAHTFNFSRDDAVYWRKDTDDECPRISQIRGAGIFASSNWSSHSSPESMRAHSSSDPFPMQCVHILQSPSTYFQSLYRGAVPAKIYTLICTWAGHGECNRQSHFRFFVSSGKDTGMFVFSCTRRSSQASQSILSNFRFTMSQPRKPVVYASIIIA